MDQDSFFGVQVEQEYIMNIFLSYKFSLRSAAILSVDQLSLEQLSLERRSNTRQSNYHMSNSAAEYLS